MAKANQNRGIPGIAELLEDFAQREKLILEDERLVFQPFFAFFKTLNLNLQYFIQSFWDN